MMSVDVSSNAFYISVGILIEVAQGYQIFSYISRSYGLVPEV